MLVEDPTYLAALQAFQLADVQRRRRPARTTTARDPRRCCSAARATGAKAAYLIPTFQNPTGRTLRAARRARAGRGGRRGRDLWLVEDDPYSALRLDGEHVDLLAAQPAARDRTIVVQTLSKVLSPGLRIGYLRAPAALRGPLAVAKQAADLHTSTVAQLAAERWLAAHDLGEHIAGLAAHYRPRRDALLAGLERDLPDGHAPGRGRRAGCSSGSTLPEGYDAEAILPRAIERGVAFVPGQATSTPASRTGRPCACPSPPRRRRSCRRAPRGWGRRSPPPARSRRASAPARRAPARRCARW